MEPSSQDLPNALTTVMPVKDSVVAVYSYCGEYLAVSDSSGRILILSTSTREVLRQMNLHVGQVPCLKWSSHSQYLVSGGEDGYCMIWDMSVSSNLPIRKLNLGSPIVALDMNQNLVSDYLYTESEPCFLLAVALLRRYPLFCDMSSRDRPRILEVPVDGQCSAALFLPCFTRVLFTNSRGKVYVYDLCNLRAEPIIERLSEGSICSAVISFAKSWLALNSASGSVYVWAFPPNCFSEPNDDARKLGLEDWPSSIDTPGNDLPTTTEERLALQLEDFHLYNNMRTGRWVNRELVWKTNLGGSLRKAKTAFEYFGSDLLTEEEHGEKLSGRVRRTFVIQSKKFRLVSELKNPSGFQPAESIAFSGSSDHLFALSLKNRHTIRAWSVVHCEGIAVYRWPEERLQCLACNPKGSGLLAVGSRSGFLYEYSRKQPQVFDGLEPMFEEMSTNVEMPIRHLYERPRNSVRGFVPTVPAEIHPQPQTRPSEASPDYPALRTKYYGPTSASILRSILTSEVRFQHQDFRDMPPTETNWA